MRIVLMGVSGCGKTSLGRAVAAKYAYKFIDADDLHPPSNIDKMSRGQALNDHDRQPWLLALRGQLEQQTDIVLAASLLKERYRQQVLRGFDDLRLYHLHGSFELIHQRMQARAHFMSADMLNSQFAALEPAENAQVLDITQSLSSLCAEFTI